MRNKWLQFVGLVGIIAISSGIALGALQEKKSSERGWLGVSIQDVTSKMAKKYNLKSEEGAYVVEVAEDSPAESAGVKKGDIVVEFNGKSIDDSEYLQKAVGNTAPKTKATVVVLRDGERKTIEVTVGRLRQPRMWGGRLGVPGGPMVQIFGSGALGLRLQELNEQLGEYFGAPNNEGVLVEEVEKGSPGDKAGFKAGDVVIRIGKRTVDAIDDITRELRKHEEGDKVEFEVLRKGAKKTLQVEIDEMNEPSSFHLFPNTRPRIQMFRFPYGGWEGDSFRIQESLRGADQLELEIESMVRQLENGVRGFKRDLREPAREILKDLTIRAT